MPRQPLAGLLGVVAAGEGRPGVAGDLHDDEGGREQHDAGMGLDRVVDLVADLVGDGARDGEAGDEVQPELRLPLAAGSGRVDVVAAEQSVAGEVGVGGPRRLHGPVADEDELLDPDDPVAAVADLPFVLGELRALLRVEAADRRQHRRGGPWVLLLRRRGAQVHGQAVAGGGRVIGTEASDFPLFSYLHRMPESGGASGEELRIVQNSLAEFPVAHRRDRIELRYHVDVVVSVHQREGHARILAARPAFPHDFRDIGRTAAAIKWKRNFRAMFSASGGSE